MDTKTNCLNIENIQINGLKAPSKHFISKVDFILNLFKT